MFNINNLINDGIAGFFSNIVNELIKFFGTVLANIMGTSLSVLDMPIVQSGIKYSKALALTILIIKAMNEGFQTYILYQNGDPDADPSGLLIRTGEAIAMIASIDFIVRQVFIFGNKVATDVAHLDAAGKTGISDWTFLLGAIGITEGSVVAIFAIIIVICFLIVAIQATIRGAELGLMCVLGPIMALNITANNRSVWSAWFRQLLIICTSQALQIFMIDGALALIIGKPISGGGLLLSFGWLWVTIKTPKYVQQIAYSTGLTGAIGGTAKQAGSMALMKMMMK